MADDLGSLKGEGAIGLRGITPTAAAAAASAVCADAAAAAAAAAAAELQMGLAEWDSVAAAAAAGGVCWWGCGCCCATGWGCCVGSHCCCRYGGLLCLYGCCGAAGRGCCCLCGVPPLPVLLGVCAGARVGADVHQAGVAVQGSTAAAANRVLQGAAVPLHFRSSEMQQQQPSMGALRSLAVTRSPATVSVTKEEEEGGVV